MNNPASYLRQVRLTTLAACLMAAAFLVFFDASKHQPALAAVNVFAEDPYDAVGSFGIQLAGLGALVSLVRSFRPYPAEITRTQTVLILRGDAVALVAVAVTMIADGVAFCRYPRVWTGSTAGWVLAGIVGGFLALTLLAGWRTVALGRLLDGPSSSGSWLETMGVCLAAFLILWLYPETWRQSVPGAIFSAITGMAILFIAASVLARQVFPPPIRLDEDFLDDLMALYIWAKAHAGFAGPFFCRIEEHITANSGACVLLNWLNPRKHVWNAILLAALGMGLALLLTEALGEGLPQRNLFLTVLAVFVGIEGTGVLLGYALFKQYLGLFRRPLAE